MYRFLFLAILVCGTTLAMAAAPATQNKAATAAQTATLYYHQNCPHCHHVMDYLNQVNKTVSLKNTSNPQYRAELNQLGQKGVPVLVVGSQVITGGDTIINYLKKHPEVLR